MGFEERCTKYKSRKSFSDRGDGPELFTHHKMFSISQLLRLILLFIISAEELF